MNPKFDQHIDNLMRQATQERAHPRYGVVMSYDSSDNTATVLLSAPDSDSMGDIISNVPCPVYMGVQNVAPEPGRPCWVAFKGHNDRSPIITHFFNHAFKQYDNVRQNTAKTSIPNFHLYM